MEKMQKMQKMLRVIAESQFSKIRTEGPEGSVRPFRFSEKNKKNPSGSIWTKHLHFVVCVCFVRGCGCEGWIVPIPHHY